MSTRETWELKERLLTDWEKISGVLAIASGDPHAETLNTSLALTSPLPEESQRSIARRWVSIFNDEIRTVMFARNAVAHAKPISEDSLRAAVGLAEELLGTLGQRLTNGTEKSAAAG